MSETKNSSEKKRILIGILFGVLLLILSAGFYALAIFMASLMLFGCVKSPPDWLYEILFIGFPIPLIFTSAIAPLLYIKEKKWPWIVLSIASGIFLSCLTFIIWFIILTQYCWYSSIKETLLFWVMLFKRSHKRHQIEKAIKIMKEYFNEKESK